MDNGWITLAIHSYGKANILKNTLEENGIAVVLEKVDINPGALTDGFYVKIREIDLNRALAIVEENKLFSYQDENIHKIDDGRKRILVAVDFSDYSTKACQIAFNIARVINAKVKILHVFHNIYFPSQIPFADTFKEESDEGLLDKTRKQMLTLCCDIDRKITEGKWPSVNYSYSLREGQADEEIENFVLEYKPFLLVLGTKGKDNNTSAPLGNVTADIIETVSVPVLAVPASSPVNSIADLKHIVFLTNFQHRDMASFHSFVQIMMPYPNIRITLLHINHINQKGDKWTEAELTDISQRFKKAYPQFNIEYKLIDSPDIPLAVSDYAKDENISVVCLNTRRRTLFGRIFAPSFSRKVLRESNEILLVLRG